MAQECVLVQTFAEAADEMSVETMHLVAKKLLMKGLMGEGECATLMDAKLKRDREANEKMTRTALKMELDQKCAHSSPAQPRPPSPAQPAQPSPPSRHRAGRKCCILRCGRIRRRQLAPTGANGRRGPARW